ncbi:MAG: protein-L-isoaspartate(D-aspartate) O-methyltransferase [Xanthomonadales bacterium]|nr:protein-L-isoaspartate(D-aspartate) O-methyltransferase [Gammaproteobacteria bacterium]MBT8050973.1 protein-L-isoaspartate(D-aspartate) O-methyltransferase [Gammaproteobacteria bacterium]MBT8056668.1 protein-L-isoaspartate(D-aspartate) O-methyltransferase [Gammaproteobacteria bacterium]NNJ79843.1 protein-L-isoaspartate(D-aspartate) O-methyltransferase [Xanthomonadales bacterium]NNL03767.1 protein-L-isoaspartate(D-aspartate) O-methyltransferase [Xanthomonadales bacterium]
MIHRRKLEPSTGGRGMTSQGTRDRLVRRLRDHGIADERVLEAIANTPRHAFIDEALSSRAYEDTALPIGLGQTISQPWVVARMTEAMLDGGTPEKVLEVGTGSGYQAAVLSALVSRIFTVERVEELLKQARRRFHKLKLKNIYTRHADGHLGWPSQAPFDGILVTAAASALPIELVAQLKEGAVMVVPVARGGMQRLLAVRRTEDGYDEEDLGGVIFVPLLAGLAKAER